MRSFFKFIAAAAPLLAASLAFGEIADSAHDFSAAGWSDGEICKPCHTPHNADISLTGRLWAHTMSSATYVFHGGSITDPNLNDNSLSPEAHTGSVGQTDMDAGSRLCLSCHDGTVALDSFMGKTGGAGATMIGSGGTAGGPRANLNDTLGLANDHPVGYRAAYKENAGLTFAADGLSATGHARYKPYSAASSAGLKFAFAPAGYNGGANLIGTGRRATTFDPVTHAVTGSEAITNYTISGRAYTTYPSVSCVTCHNVHNSGTGTASEEPGLLRMSNEGSALCLTCHDK